MNCPFCGVPVDDHWRISMTFDELDAWSANTTVCWRPKSDVKEILRLTLDTASNID